MVVSKLFNQTKSFFAREDINTNRQVNIDFAKVMAIIFMVLEHCMLHPLYHDMQHGFGLIVYTVLGGFLAAPIFMLCMGVGLSYSRNNEPNKIIFRGIKLFALAYVLNLVREIGPFIYRASTMPIDKAWAISSYGFFCGDIMQFAGLALITFGLLSKFKHRLPIILSVGIVLNLVFTFAPNIVASNSYLAMFLGIFVPIMFEGEMWSIFPLVTWFIFVGVGYLFGLIIRKVSNLNKFYGWTALIGLLLFTTFFLLDLFLKISINKVGMTNIEYFNMTQVCLYSIGSALFIFSLFYFVSRITSEKINALSFKISDSINEIYFVSWALVCNVFFIIFGFIIPKQYDVWVYLIAWIIILVASCFLGYYFRKFKKNLKSKKRLENTKHI